MSWRPLFRFADLTFAARSTACAGMASPICSSDSGYYYADTEEELQRTIRQLRSRIKKIAHAERGLTKALEQFTDSGQISLPLEGGDTA